MKKNLLISVFILLVLLACGGSEAIVKTEVISVPSIKIETVQPAPAVTTLFLELVAVPKSISKGKEATLVLKTSPNAVCNINVKYPSGNSTADGLEQKIAGNDGIVSWVWKVGTRTKPGTYMITVFASLNGEIISKNVPFTVIE